MQSVGYVYESYPKRLKSELPYERMNITGTKGLTESQKSILRSVGAVEKVEPNNEGSINC